VVSVGKESPGIRGVPPGEYVVLGVHDTGSGMDSATQSKIFEPFFTTKPVGEGTGLGLSTVYGIVQQSNGFITVESEPGGGTVFRIFLPLVEHPEEDRGDLPVVAAPPPAFERRATVLLVEDDDRVRRLTRRVLEHYGFGTIEARTGHDALEALLLEDTPPIHAVVSDVVMPGMSGRELVGKIRALRPDIPVVFLSGYAGDEMSDEIRANARQTFLQKPFSPDALASALEALLADQIP
jgi:two-component system cell cycle sensor histidine kinase/response regulator CckA